MSKKGFITISNTHIESNNQEFFEFVSKLLLPYLETYALTLDVVRKKGDFNY